MPKMQDEEKIENPPQDQPKWWRSGAVNLSDHDFSLYPCLYGPLSLPLFLPFLPPLGAASLPFCGAMKKAYLELGGGIPFGAFG